MLCPGRKLHKSLLFGQDSHCNALWNLYLSCTLCRNTSFWNALPGCVLKELVWVTNWQTIASNQILTPISVFCVTTAKYRNITKWRNVWENKGQKCHVKEENVWLSLLENRWLGVKTSLPICVGFSFLAATINSPVRSYSLGLVCGKCNAMYMTTSALSCYGVLLYPSTPLWKMSPRLFQGRRVAIRCPTAGRERVVRLLQWPVQSSQHKLVPG